MVDTPRHSNESSTLALTKGRLSQELIDLMESLGVELTDEGLLTMPDMPQAIDLAKKGVSEVYIGSEDRQVFIFTKTNDGQWESYSTRRDGMNYSNSIGLTQEEAFNQMKRLGIGPNSSAVAVAKTPNALLEGLNDGPAVSRVEDLEGKIKEAKELGRQTLGDLTKLKEVHKELATMLSEFLEVPGNTVHAEYNNNGIEKKITGVSYDKVDGLSLEGGSNKGLFSNWGNFRFDNSGSKGLNLKEGWTGIKDSFSDQV